MKKKYIILYVLVLCLAFFGIGLAVYRFFVDKIEDDKAVEEQSVPSKAGLLNAIPSDAVVIFSFHNAKTCANLLNDRTKCFRPLLGHYRQSDSFITYIKDSISLKSHPMAVSVHFSGSLVPLYVFETGSSSDTTSYEKNLMSAAAVCGMESNVYKGSSVSFVLVSPSETLIESSRRHLSQGASVLDDRSFLELASNSASKDVLFLSNHYAGRVMSSLFRKPLLKHTPFVSNFSDWAAFEIEESSPARLSIRSSFIGDSNPRHFCQVLEHMENASCNMVQAVPANAFLALSLCVSDLTVYTDSYLRYVDARQKSLQFRNRCDSLKNSTGIEPQEWASSYGICEIARIQWPSASGMMMDAVMFRPDRNGIRKINDGAFPYGVHVAMMFGDFFSLPADSQCIRKDGWVVVGSCEALDSYAGAVSQYGTIESSMPDVSETVPSKSVRMVTYFSASKYSAFSKDYLAPMTDDSVRGTLDGTDNEYALFCFSSEGSSLDVYRAKGNSKSFGRTDEKPVVTCTQPGASSVTVPEGPFEVMNCASGKINLFYQTPSYYLCLKDKESGKGLWGVPFDSPICGYVSQVDLFNNGKIQFLFASGSKLYLIDRLGRFVSGFPVELDKEVLLGPQVYGDAGSGYQAMVLHSDNSIGLYDLQGVPVSEWCGIVTKDTILELPQLELIGGNRYWSVKTSSGLKFYDGMGGNALSPRMVKKLKHNKS